ncbi:unnamed protein product [Lepeophtheirus salmonis]|nr:unnamed protein product [Lepeophtheirus salmonis]CAF2942504.1 unnamed protein product [Lepeophtheirus salmonis]
MWISDWTSGQPILLFLKLIILSPTVECVQNTCSTGLGLENGSITSSQIKVTPHTTTPEHESRVEFQVDLEQIRLISGFQSQGPPESHYSKEYTRYVGLGIDLSLDGIYWTRIPSQFYASDEPGSVDVIQTHIFETIQTARHIRISVSSDVRWIGHSNKCFRFEILGCPLDISLDVNLQHTLHPEGLITANWRYPHVYVTYDRNIPIPCPYYIVGITIKGSNDKWDYKNVSSDASMILDRPLWDSTYHFKISCVHQNISIDCGKYEIETSSLRSRSTEIVFDKPTSLQAIIHENGTLFIDWNTSLNGWRSSTKVIKLLNQNSEKLLDAITEDSTVYFHDISIGDYYVSFEPGGSNIPKNTELLTVHLIIVSNELNEIYAFLGSTDLTLKIIWSGSLHASWSMCKGRGVSSKKASIIDVDEYRIFLLNGSSSVIYSEGRLSPHKDNASFIFPGMSLNVEYIVKIQCMFRNKVFSCGEDRIFTNTSHYSTLYKNKTEIYVPTGFPSIWSHLNDHCLMSRGHLVSLDRSGLDGSLWDLSSFQDFWTGGNICRNSPAPSYSMWSDGSLNARINFAPDSELDGSHCCVKSSRNEQNQSLWKGESCDTILYGICEYVFAEIMDDLSDLRGESGSSNSISLSWNTQGLFWQPTSYSIQACLNRTLYSSTIIAGSSENCSRILINSTQTSVSVNDLDEFSEYDLKITASLNPYFLVNKTLYVKSRTQSSKSVEFTISSNGIFQTTWLRKVALFKEEESIRLNVSSDGFNIGGESYTYYLEDELGGRLGPLQFEAYPNCTNGIRNYTFCMFILDKNLSYGDRNEECRSLGFNSDSILSESQLIHFHLWDIVHESLLFWIQSNGSSLDSKNRTLCRAWSRSLKLYTFTECNEKLPVLCFGDIQIDITTPTRKDLKIASGPTHITIDWSTPRNGWYVNYTVSYMDEMIFHNRSKRTTQIESQIRVHGPPINITGLLPRRSYSVTVMTALNNNTVRSLTVEGLSTTSDRRMSREIAILTNPKRDVLYAQISLISICALLTFIAIILLAWSRTLSLYPENLVQLCFQISTLCFYISFMLFTKDGPLAMDSESQVNCLIGIFVFNYLYMCMSMFLFLESMIIMHQLVDSVVLPYLSQNVSVFAFLGFGLPFVYVLAGVLSLANFLVPINAAPICWMNLDVMESSVFYAPMALLILLTLSSPSYPFAVHQRSDGSNYPQRKLQEDGKKTHSTPFVMLLFSSPIELFFLFLAIHFLLSFVLLFFRIFYDREVMTRIKRTRMTPSEVEEQYVKERNGGGLSRMASGVSKKSIRNHSRSLSNNSIITPVESSDMAPLQSISLTSASSRPRPMSVASISERISEEDG